MKFSYNIFKDLVPNLPPIAELAEKITMHLFEVESAAGDVLDISILPNRYSDAACYRGLAREIAAICNVPHAEQKVKKPKPEVKKAVPAEIHIQNLCRRIMTVYIENIRIAPSPDWLVQALRTSGIRPINNLVDITNYVMLEVGQPLHAFDYEKIQGGKISVRQAHEGEIVETLDGKKITLNPSALVLADETSALDIAGIKGGTKAQITDATKIIALTAANFDGTVIYKTVKRIGIATDASIRFSHHLNPVLVKRGLYRAVELIQELCGGKRGIINDTYPKPAQPPAIIGEVKKYNALTGDAFTNKEFFGYLKKLGFTIAGKKITPPAERTDIEGFHDIVEEAARLHGLERIAPVAPRITLAPPMVSAIGACKDRARAYAANAGYTEIYTHSFRGAGDIPLENPLTAEQSFLRASLREGLREAAEKNLRFTAEVKLFEIGSVFFKKTNYEPGEEIHIGLIISGKKNNPSEQTRILQGSVEYLLKNLGIEKYQCAEQDNNVLAITVENETVGTIACEQRAYGNSTAEINLTQLLSHETTAKEYQPIGKYPVITRDISILVMKRIRVGTLMERIKTAASNILQKIDFIGAYEDRKWGEEKHSLTFRIVFGNPNHTLEDAHADREIQAIIMALKEDFRVEIR